ncbi:hypothetical protein AKJ55_01615 [candidate division MSBL1 archaeon SCGC-AAA382M17]|uniref:Transposase n=1 Tax=candidate division MSBL1 archaeon SCGC-AAA382M17 TaxID=1698284 RepID=A0ABR5TJ92_9EURY|nr:hypothetical protein AKJ55_01615 [candidate division MSBL1 archaeon SCGC-AAA382M17]
MEARFIIACFFVVRFHYFRTRPFQAKNLHWKLFKKVRKFFQKNPLHVLKIKKHMRGVSF